MPLWKNTQHAFIAGQLDANVMGRQDMDRYFKGATLLKNFLVKRQGCISKRRGTDLTADLDGLLGTTYDGTPITPGKMRLVPVTNGDDGRYVILSGGIGFVASREGILTSDNRHVRTVSPYVAIDEDGKAVVIAGKDMRQSTETPVDLIHRVSAGNYTVTRHATLQAAFNAAYSDALAERTEAANNERAAQRELLQAIVHGQASDAEQRRAVARDAMTRYLERLRQVDQQRASNPLPETNCAR